MDLSELVKSKGCRSLEDMVDKVQSRHETLFANAGGQVQSLIDNAEHLKITLFDIARAYGELRELLVSTMNELLKYQKGEIKREADAKP